jgi:uncharacterized OsmC-like protein
MVKMSVDYTGGLHCDLVHGPSSTRIETDAPKDNMGKGERFSPTDLVGAALGSCMLTTMAIFAKRDGLELDGAKAVLTKEMVATPSRRIGALTVEITMPASLPQAARAKLEEAGINCPVQKSLHPDVKIPVKFVYR